MSDLHEALERLRTALVEEATPLPGSQLAYGRPHEHPRNRFFPRYSSSGRRLEGTVQIGPDCPRPVHGRCECPPDGSWRPAVGVIRADATASHAVAVPASRLRPALEGALWVADVYEQAPDGLWHCRWPTRAALERLRGVSPRRWAIAVALLGGRALAAAPWGSHGVPPDPAGEAFRILRQLEAWADQERSGEWERRPRQWWDPPRQPRRPKSESQAIAEHPCENGLQRHSGTATLPPGPEALTEPRSGPGLGPRAETSTDHTDVRPPKATASPLDVDTRLCA